METRDKETSKVRTTNYAGPELRRTRTTQDPNYAGPRVQERQTGVVETANALNALVNRPDFSGDSVRWIFRPLIGRPEVLRRRNAVPRTRPAEDSRGVRA